MKRIITALTLWFTISSWLCAQEVVTGTVVDTKNEPVPGAKVEIVGTPDFTTTDIDGRFRIETEQPAKKIRVSYVKFKPVTKKIKPDMTIKIGRNWRQGPEHYQWFVGAQIGIGGLPDVYLDNIDLYPYQQRTPTFSIMGGGVKKIGWYAKYSYYRKNDLTLNSFTLGGLFRLWCPLHLYIGAGVSHLDFPNRYNPSYFNKWNANIDSGFMFRFKDFGINLGSLNTLNTEYYLYVSVNVGFSYFFK